jgi:FkbM family methyltransferase
MDIPYKKGINYYHQNGFLKFFLRLLDYIVSSYRRNYYIVPLERLQWEKSKKLAVYIYLLTHWVVPGLSIVVTYENDGLYKATNVLNGESYYFPELPGVVELRNVGLGYSDKMYNKYTLSGFVEPKDGDTIVDGGAFVGAFTLSISDIASEVIAYEPSSENCKALRKNTNTIDDMLINQCGLSNENSQRKLKLGADITDHSFVNVDGKAKGSNESVDVVRLDSLLNSHSMIDFLKLDAEGNEPEAIEGASDITIKKIAVDCGAERHGEPTFDSVRNLLEKRNYEVRRRGHMLFAKLHQNGYN